MTVLVSLVKTSANKGYVHSFVHMTRNPSNEGLMVMLEESLHTNSIHKLLQTNEKTRTTAMTPLPPHTNIPSEHLLYEVLLIF